MVDWSTNISLLANVYHSITLALLAMPEVDGSAQPTRLLPPPPTPYTLHPPYRLLPPPYTQHPPYRLLPPPSLWGLSTKASGFLMASATTCMQHVCVGGGGGGESCQERGGVAHWPDPGVCSTVQCSEV